MKLLKWKKEIIDRLEKTSNFELLQEVLWLAQGDDYDGGFTDKGQWEYNKAQEILNERLIKNNFFTKEEMVLK